MKKANRFLSLMLVIMILAANVLTVQLNAFADTSHLSYYERGILTDGTNTAYYVIDKDNKYLYITGDGSGTPAKTPDYAAQNKGPFAGRTDVETIVIADGVEYVGDYCCSNMTAVSKLIIKSNLLKSENSVSAKAFLGDTSIRDVQGDSSVVSLSTLTGVAKVIANIVSADYLSLIKNVISTGSGALKDDGTVDQDVLNAMVDDYITTGDEIYLAPLSEVTESYQEKTANPCYVNHAYHHQFSDEVTTAATCTEDGVLTRYCSVCKNTYTEPITAEGHDYKTSYYMDLAPTCTQMGVLQYQCDKCGDIKFEMAPALGHSLVTDEGFDPTCTTEGLTDGTHCSVCGEVITAQESIATLPHTYSYYFNESENTYTAVCDVCQTAFTDFRPDITALVSAVSYAKEFQQEDYTEESYQALVDAYAPFRSLKNDDDLQYPQFAVDESTYDILTKISELVPNLALNVKGIHSDVTVNYGGVTYSDQNYLIEIGTNVTVYAEGEEGYEFVGWYETKTNRYCSYTKEYSFLITSNTNLEARFVKDTAASLIFTNDTGQVCDIVTKTAAEWQEVQSIAAFVPESVPFKYGSTDGRWENYSDSEVLNSLRNGSDVTIKPVYTALDIVLPTQPVSTDGVPALTLSYDMTSGENVEDSAKGSFIMAADIPSGCVIEEIGVAFYVKSSAKFDPTNFDLTINNKMLTSKFYEVEDSGIYIVNITNLNPAMSYAAKGYIAYYDSNWNLQIIYTNQINVINLLQVN